MRKLLFLYITCTLAIQAISFAQKNTDTVVAQVYYKSYLMYDTIKKLATTENMILNVGKHSSQYMSYDKVYNDSLLKELIKQGSPYVMDRSKNGMRRVSSDIIIKHYDQIGKLEWYKKILKVYVITEDVNKLLTWQITGETKQVGQLTVTKANCRFKGRKYEAWFCADIPIQDGPYKFCGLPGLIIEMADSTGTVKFSFLGFKNVAVQNNLMPEIPKKVFPVSHQEYVQLEKAFRNDPETFLNNESADLGLGISDIKTNVGPNYKTPNWVNNHVELEDY